MHIIIKKQTSEEEKTKTSKHIMLILRYEQCASFKVMHSTTRDYLFINITHVHTNLNLGDASAVTHSLPRLSVVPALVCGLSLRSSLRPSL